MMMITRLSGADSIASKLAIGIVALMAAGLHYSPALAQSADLVLCDRLAADPYDPDKPADVKGTATVAAADIATALKFCKIAAAGSRRAMYQLGRAYAANRQMPEAIVAYRKAADKGSTSAMVELGVLYGTGAGLAKDPAEARNLFERAAAAGYRMGASIMSCLCG
jgi:TPR repeat protein